MSDTFFTTDKGGWIASFIYYVVKVYQKCRNYSISRSCGFGKGFNVSHTPKILGARNIIIGGSFFAGRNLWIEAIGNHNGNHYTPSLTIGDNVSASDNVHIACCFKVQIDNDVLIGSKVLITDHGHGIYSGAITSDPTVPPNQRKLSGAPVHIGARVWIGDGVCIMPGVTIGEGCVIGAMSVVTKSIPPNCLAVGTPARVVKIYNQTNQTWVACESQKQWQGTFRLNE